MKLGMKIVGISRKAKQGKKKYIGYFFPGTMLSTNRIAISEFYADRVAGTASQKHLEVS